MLSGVFDLKGAQSYLTVRRARRCEKTPLSTVHLCPQQLVGEICGLRGQGYISNEVEAVGEPQRYDKLRDWSLRMTVDLNNIAQPGTQERLIADQLDLERLPRHVAVIMDGNGRWAKARHLPRVEGHRVGITSVRSTIELIAQLEIPVVTLYAFSTENWKRPRHEVMTLMTLLKEYINRELASFCRNNLKFQTIGRIDGLDLSVQKEINRAIEATSECTGSIVQIALNYSGRQELTDVVRQAATKAKAGELDPAMVNETWISDHLQTGGLPEPDLMIRTSGEQRISNFLLWQLAYSEIYFSTVLWPDFDTLELLKALLEFQQRNRRFGGLVPDTAPTDQKNQKSTP